MEVWGYVRYWLHFDTVALCAMPAGNAHQGEVGEVVAVDVYQSYFVHWLFQIFGIYAGFWEWRLAVFELMQQLGHEDANLVRFVMGNRELGV